MKRRERIIASILLCIISFSNILTPVAYAAPLVKFHAKKPAVNFQAASLVPNSSVVQPDQGSVLGVSTSLVTDGTVPLTLDGENGDSANIRIAPRMEELPKQVYKTDEDVMLSVINPDNEPITAKITDAGGADVSAPISEGDNGTTTTLDIAASDSLHPGRYTVAITDSHGQITTQDFTWGVLAMNFDKSEYHPGDTGDISFAVLNDKGDMVCDASLMLRVTNAGLGVDDTLQTGITGKNQIVINPQCQSHDYSLQSDYEAHYTFRKPGVYNMALTAMTTGEGSHSISDSITVTNDIPFDVQRVSATRIYPPNTYPVLFNITANRDFTGTVTETVPDSFTVTPATQSAVQGTGQGGSVTSYSNMQTVYLNNNDPSSNLQQAIIASDSSGLVMPFTGSYPITQGFGAQQTDPSLQAFYTQFGLAGHDGVDFGVPMDTPLYAVDNGTVIWSGPGDYGITIIIQHGWGESYYGHLSSTVAKVGQAVLKGQLIGYSGESGDATGPHLHFGMRPDNSDMTNGYYGKIDPLPYLPFGHEPQPIASIVPSGSLADATQVGISQNDRSAVLAASDSGSTGSPTPSEIPSTTVQPSVTNPSGEPTVTEAASGSAEDVSPTQVPEIATPTLSPQASINQTPTEVATGAADESFSILEKQIQLNEALAASTQTEKVKVITWQVSLKKGQSTTLGYDYQAPKVSPEFYMIGPLQFYGSGSNKVVFQEQRQWEIASDDVGVEWLYQPTVNQPWNGYNWQKRQKITLNATQIASVAASPTFDAQSVVNKSTAVTTFNWTHTVGNFSNRLLVVAFNVDTIATDVVTSATYGTQSMTRYESFDGASVGDYEIWYLVNPTVGTNTIAVNMNTSTAVDGTGASFYNANQANPLGSVTTASNASNSTGTGTVNITTTPGQMVLDTLSTPNGSSDAYVQGGGQTKIWAGSQFVIGSYKTATSTSTPMSWTWTTADTYEYMAVPINPASLSEVSSSAQSTAPITFMESGSDATKDLSFYQSATGDSFNTGTGAFTSDCTMSETGPCSVELNAGTGTTGLATPVSSLPVSGRISVYTNFATLPGSLLSYLNFYTAGNGFESAVVQLDAAHQLECEDGLTHGNTVLAVNTWYRISVGYTTVGTTLNYKIYISGNLEVTCPSSTMGAGSPPSFLILGANVAGQTIHFDDLYVDSGQDMSDTGDVHVTAKLPFANGGSNAFNTVIGSGSGYGSGHAPFVNVRPVGAGNGYKATANSEIEEYTLEGLAQGDVNISSNSGVLGQEAWINLTSSGTCTGGSAAIINNGVNTNITLPTSESTLTNIVSVANNTYPTSNQAVGMESCTAGTAQTISLYGTGMLIAYIPDLTNFPVLVSTTDSSLVGNTLSNGSDIAFTDSTGETLLPFELQDYNSAQGTVTAWVNVATLSAQQNNIIYMYYNDPTASGLANAGSTWNSNYKAVLHMNKGGSLAAGGQTDSTSNGNNGTNDSANVTSVAGLFDNATNFNGTATGFTDIANSATINFGSKVNYTVSGWFKSTEAYSAASYPSMIWKEIGSPRQGYAVFTTGSGGTTDLGTEDWVNGTQYFNTTSNYNNGGWHYVTAERYNNGLLMYVDGNFIASASAVGQDTTNTSNLYMGTDSGGNNKYNGILQEIHLSNVALSPGWITTEYNNQATPSAFETFSSTIENNIYAPKLTQVLRHGQFFGNVGQESGVMQPFTW
jgi:murein DD-endopeptidase MepM/ murein hydrolase activator NlpD